MKKIFHWSYHSAIACGVICAACTTERPGRIPHGFMSASVGIVTEAHLVLETPEYHEAVAQCEAGRRVVVKDSRTIGRLTSALTDCESGPAGPCPVLPPIATVYLYDGDGSTVMIISLRTGMGDMYVGETVMDRMGNEIGPNKFLGDMRNTRFADLVWQILKE